MGAATLTGFPPLDRLWLYVGDEILSLEDILWFVWEHWRFQDSFKKDWSKFFKKPDEDTCVKLLNTYGHLSYPKSQDFSREFRDLPMSACIFPQDWTADQLKILAKSLKTVGASDRVMRLTFGLVFHKKDQDNDFSVKEELNVEWPDEEETSPFNKTLKDGVQPYKIISKDSLPDELVIRIENFPAFLLSDSNVQDSFIEEAVQRVEYQLGKWKSSKVGPKKSEKKQEKYTPDKHQLAKFKGMLKIYVWHKRGITYKQIAKILKGRSEVLKPGSAASRVGKAFKGIEDFLTDSELCHSCPKRTECKEGCEKLLDDLEPLVGSHGDSALEEVEAIVPDEDDPFYDQKWRRQNRAKRVKSVE